MKKFLAFLAVLMWAPGVMGLDVTKMPNDTRKGYIVEFDSGDIAGVYNIGQSLPLALIGFEQGSSFTGEVFACEDRITSLGQAIDADTCDSLLTITGDAALVERQTVRMHYVIEITVAEGAGTTSRLVIRGTVNQVSGGSGIEVFTGGVASISDTQNPNDKNEDFTFDDAIDCRTRCFFQSSETKGGGWWTAVAVGVGTTVWSPQNEIQILSFIWNPPATPWNSDTWDTNKCIFAVPGGSTDSDAAVSCTTATGVFYLPRTFVTRIAFGLNEASVATSSCDLRMTERGGVTPVANTTMTLGETLVSIGDIESIYVGTEVPEGLYNMQGRNGGAGTGCPNGSSCVCKSGIEGNAMVMGFPMQ